MGLSIFADMVSAGLDLVRGVAGECVTYDTGSHEYPINAVPADGERREDVGNRIALQSEDQDWLIGKEELTPCLPQNGFPREGHLIRRRLGNRLLTYSITAVPDGQCWRWSDTGHTQYRIHSKLIKQT